MKSSSHRHYFTDQAQRGSVVRQIIKQRAIRELEQDIAQRTQNLDQKSGLRLKVSPTKIRPNKHTNARIRSVKRSIRVTASQSPSCRDVSRLRKEMRLLGEHEKRLKGFLDSESFRSSRQSRQSPKARSRSAERNARRLIVKLRSKDDDYFERKAEAKTPPRRATTAARQRSVRYQIM